MKEAIERTFEPPEVHHERLFAISVLGFIVNLVGIFVFQHGGQSHHHGTGVCSHSHSHPNSLGRFEQSNHDHVSQSLHVHSHYPNRSIVSKEYNGAIALDMNDFSSTSDYQMNPPTHLNSHFTSANSIGRQDHKIHGDHHNCSHAHSLEDDVMAQHAPRAKSKARGQIMQSVFLHIVADTLGSIGVMISALLMNQFGWMIADPLCSLFIAILISISVYPLLRDSFYILMQRVPVDIEEKLPACLQRIQSISGVLSVHETHFWTLNSDTYIGCLKLEVAQGADHRYIMANAKILLNQLGVERLHIQIDQA